MEGERICRSCGCRFRPFPQKPGYVDECQDCAAHRLRLNAVPAKTLCRICGKPVENFEKVHASCLERKYVLSLTATEFEELIQLKVKHRWDWPAVFSTNEYRDIWPFLGYGYSRANERRQVRGVSKIVDAVADEFLKMFPAGGRFFINDTGAFYKDEYSRVTPVLAFAISKPEALG